MVNQEVLDRITKQISEMSVNTLQDFINKFQKTFNIQEEQSDSAQIDEESSKEYEDLLKELLGMNMHDLNQLVKYMEETLGIKASLAIGSGGADEEGEEKKQEEKSHYQVVISSFKQDASYKIPFVKLLIASIPGFALPDALKVYTAIFTQSEPYVLVEKASKDEANSLKTALEEYTEVSLK